MSKLTDFNIISLEELDQANATNNNLLKWNGSQYLPSTVALSELDDVSISSSSSGQVLIWNLSNGAFENSTLTPGRDIGINNSDGGVTVNFDETWKQISSNYTASSSERLLVDTSGGSLTVTLPSSPSVGDNIFFADSARTWDTYSLIVDGNGNNLIGNSSVEIDNLDWSFSLVFNGAQWVFSTQSGDRNLNLKTVTAAESGSVPDTKLGIIAIDHLADQETLTVEKAVFLLADGQPSPSGLDLVILTLDNSGGSTQQTTILAGDDTSVFDDETGSPLSSYQNTSGSGQTVAIAVDNTTGSSKTVYVRVQGETK